MIIRFFFLVLLLCNAVLAQAKSPSYSPNDIYAGVEYANTMLDKIFLQEGIDNINNPVSKEHDIKPMHVYELHVTALNELYHYSLKHNRKPPVQVVSSPIKYSPTNVYDLTQIIIGNLEHLYLDKVGKINFQINSHTGKTPSDVYQQIFELYYKLNRLNGKTKVSPTEVYQQIFRAKEDLQYTLISLSNRLKPSEKQKKRLLVTAIHGMNTDGTMMKEFEPGKKPKDVLEIAFAVRNTLNQLRTQYKLPPIALPSLSSYSTIKPIDIILQTQFIIAELNLLKIPMNIHNSTNSSKPASAKTPSDVYQEMRHIHYMLLRLQSTL